MMKSFAISAVAAVMLLTSGTAAAEIVKINVGPTLNPFFLRLVCNRVAGERGGRFIRSERSGANKDGVCYVDIPRRSGGGGIVTTPGTVNQVRPLPTQQQGTIRQPVQQQGTIRQPAQQAAPSSTANVEMVNVGRLWSQAHAEDRCKAIAASKQTVWTGIWKKHDSRGEAQCQLRKKPDFVLKAVSTDRIWSDSHAKYKCPQVAKSKGGVWAGNWRADPKDKNKSSCMVKMKIVPMTVKAFVTTKIWSDTHAKQHCTQLARQNKGQWQGEWRNTQDNKSSICMLKVPQQRATPVQQAAPAQNNTRQPATTTQATPIWNQNVRNVKAGSIWDQAHAERKCPVVARNAKGSWTQRWTKTGPGNTSVCEVKFGSGIVAQATKPVATTATQHSSSNSNSNRRTRNVAAGPIWDDKQAAKKCPVVAANNKANWTGKWTKTGPGHTSVCEISVGVAVKPAQTQQQTQQQAQQPIQIKVSPNKTREVPVGGIWDQAQAVKKCPIAAKSNKGSWTGKWRKISTTNAVCEIKLP